MNSIISEQDNNVDRNSLSAPILRSAVTSPVGTTNKSMKKRPDRDKLVWDIDQKFQLTIQSIDKIGLPDNTKVSYVQSDKNKSSLMEETQCQAV